MALTDAQLRDYFNSYFTRNNRKEILGNQVNYAFTQMLEYVNDSIAGVGGDNMATADLTFSGSRTHNVNSFNIDFVNMRGLNMEAVSAPSLGYASYTYEGYGSGASNIIAEWRNGSSTRSFYITGLGEVNNRGKLGISSNCAFGTGVLTNLNTGGATDNTGFGYNALLQSTSGQSNAAFGSGALQTNNNAQNAAFGHNVLNISTGTQNTAMGWRTMYLTTSGGYNTSIGCSSGDALTTGSYNTFLGRVAGSGISTGNYNTVLGVVSGLSAGLTGNVILANGQGTKALHYDTNGNIIMGPAAALATAATDGFLYIPSMPGPPSGTPSAITGRVPMCVDSTNNQLYIYPGGAWVAV